VTDPKNNSTTYAYDQNSNVVSETETAKSDLGLPDETFVTTHTFDGLDRRASSTDSSGNQHACGYDSRGNRTVVVDALNNETRCVYDGLNRVTELTVDVDGDGADGDGADITTFQVWDDNSRCVSRSDDNGNATTYEYDALDRLVATNSADGTSESRTYDVHDNKLTHTDANGTVVTNTYDALDRLTGKSIAVGTGVSNDTTFESHAYDGLSRKTSSQDDDVVQTFTWTSMSDFRSETLNGDTTSATYDGVGNRLTLTYPSGRTIDYAYDNLDRIAAVTDANAPVATYQYVGADRVTRQTYGNGADTRYTYDGVQGVPNPPLDSGVKRVVRSTHAKGGSIIDDRAYTWDAMYNKTERRDLRAGGPRLRHAYSYDHAYRMTQGRVEDGGGIPIRQSDYTLDGVGNRQQISGFGGQTGPYAMDPASPPADFQMNQYTMTPRDNRTYDDNGSLAGAVSGPFTTVCAYDYANRLVSWENTFTGDRVDFSYDTSGRRISKVVMPGGCCPLESRYRYGMSAEVIEEQDPNAGILRTYVYGSRANEIVCVEQGGTIVYHHADDQGSVMALSDPNGAVVERYEYDDYGAPQFFDGAGTPQPRSLVGNSYLFHGLRCDSETGWYLNGANYLDPINGRYIMRAGAGMWSDVRVAGNAYDYSGGNPLSAHLRGRPMKAGISGSTRGHGRAMGPGICGSPRRRGAVSGGGGGTYSVCYTVNSMAAPGGGGGTCDGCDAIAGSRSVDRTCPHHGHVTILKASGISGNHCPGCGAMLCRCKDTATRSVGACYCGAPYSHHHGRVTVLKAHAGNGNGPGENGGIIKAAGDGNHCPGCGAMLCRCKDGPTRAADGDDKKHKHRGHVTILKIAAPGGGNHCPGCGAMLCRCKDNATRAANDDKKRKHKGHVTILKIAAPGGGGGMTGQMMSQNMEFLATSGGEYETGNTGARSAAKCCPHFFDINLTGGGSGAAGSGFKKCGCSHCNTICMHGVTETKCKECPDGPLPAANNISSR
jgi:YD repeat-containing protein